MKMFVLIPSAELAHMHGLYPLVACDDKSFADNHQTVHNYTSLIYSNHDKVTIDSLEVGEKAYDGQGWHWWRANDVSYN